MSLGARMSEQPVFHPPTHPLDLLAATMDALLAKQTGAETWAPSLADLAACRRQRPEQACSAAREDALMQKKDDETALSDGLAAKDKAWRATLSRLAAHLAVRNQVMLLGPQKVDEEPQTAALFGLLANALSMVTLLAPDDVGSVHETQIPGCYWAHQKKQSDEPRTGGDFGIITDLGGDMVKLTLFQAKRPQQGHQFKDLRHDHRVHPKMLERPPESDPYAYLQYQTLNEIRSLLKKGCSLDKIVKRISQQELRRTGGNPNDLWQIVCSHGEDSLFISTYSYLQSTVFLAAELKGWLQTGGASFSGWCYYVQWPYGNVQSPWAISVIEALGPDGGTNAFERSLPFVDILAQALSPEKGEFGIVIPCDDLSDWAEAISALMPGTLWGGSAGSAEGAARLVRTVSPLPREIQQIGLLRSTVPNVVPESALAPKI